MDIIEDTTIWCDKCDCEYAEYKYEGEYFCGECLLLKLSNQNKIQTWNVNHYMINDEYCGNDNDNDISKIIEEIISCSYKNLNIKELEESK